MSWITLNTGSLKAAMTDNEWQKFTTHSTGSLSSNEIIDAQRQMVVNEIRGAVASCSDNTLDADTTTIPSRLERDAVAIWLYDVMSRIGGNLIDLKGTRQRKYDEAKKKLDEIASCNVVVDQPDGSESGDEEQAFVGSDTKLLW